VQQEPRQLAFCSSHLHCPCGPLDTTPMILNTLSHVSASCLTCASCCSSHLYCSSCPPLYCP
jgi:hypothetical protein